MIRHRLVLIAVVLGTTIAACDSQAQSPAPPTALPKLVVGVATDLPHLGLFDKYNRSGFENDLYLWLGSHVAPQFTPSPTPVAIAARTSNLVEGRVDMVVDVYSITDERQRSVAFAGPYLITKQSAMTRKGDKPITSLEQLSGKNVCVPSNSTSRTRLRESPLLSKIELTEETSSQACVDDLLVRRVDVVSMDQIILFGFMLEHPDKLQVEPEMTFGGDERYGIGVPRENMALCKELVQGLRKFLIDGQWVTFFQQNFPGIDTRPFRPDPDGLDSCEPPDDIPAGSPPPSG